MLVYKKRIGHLSSGNTIVSAISNEGCLQIYMSTFASLRLNLKILGAYE